ncbi:cellulose binding domain-containing protein [Deinococcus maricopensis]|uniref:cellulose binding domain-containing protein n=1 Tax=Deinococcus maricopensis TaxID=309887 RepID=UPI00031D6A06|nr:cellulose binding domain-containing protein [Deinococcus maricopensis]
MQGTHHARTLFGLTTTALTLALTLAACAQSPGTPGTSALHAQATSATATFSTSSSWDGGFNGVITLSNPTSTPLTTWTLKFKFNGAASTTSVWGAGGSVTTASDGTVTITPNTWGGSTIPANGSVTVNYGGSGTYSGVNTCTLNGAPCSGGTTPPRAGTPPRPPSA